MARTVGAVGKIKIALDDIKEIHGLCVDANITDEAIIFIMKGYTVDGVKAIIADRKHFHEEVLSPSS